MISHYYKRIWNETRGDEYDHWGPSVWYFECTEPSGIVREQIEIYQNGNALFYGEDGIVSDNYGGLSEIPFEIEEWVLYEISKSEYVSIKVETLFINRGNS